MPASFGKCHFVCYCIQPQFRRPHQLFIRGPDERSDHRFATLLMCRIWRICPERSPVRNITYAIAHHPLASTDCDNWPSGSIHIFLEPELGLSSEQRWLSIQIE